MCAGCQPARCSVAYNLQHHSGIGKGHRLDLNSYRGISSINVEGKAYGIQENPPTALP